MAALRSRCGHYILWFYLLFSSPNLSRRRLDVCHTSTHGVALVRIWDAGLKRAARGLLKIQDAKIAIWAPSHNLVGLCLLLQLIKARIDIWKKIVKQQYLLHMSS